MATLSRLPSRLLQVHPEVRSAIASRTPVVALESTIITHGLPAPQNLNVALALEDAVRRQGAVPATMALVDGRAHVGLERHHLERLAETGTAATKTSRRDIGAVLAAGKGSIGATTVSGTMVLAHLAGGIHTFGTGGIGGVHRGGQASMDVSADLTELSRTPIAVFSSGAKSILDIPRTLEYLETMGVAVHTFQKNGHFPAFYTSQSGVKVPAVATEQDAARIIHASLSVGLTSGMLFGVPIPAKHEQAGLEIQHAVEQAVREHVEQGIDRRGKEATPWLLSRVKELSNGASVASNTALVINNVEVAARTAVRLAALQAESDAEAAGSSAKVYALGNHAGSTISAKLSDAAKRADSIVFGFAAVDITSRPDADTQISATRELDMHVGATWPGRNSLSLGGVGRNLAEASHALQESSEAQNGARTLLVSPVGDDDFGRMVRDGLSARRMADDGLEAFIDRGEGSARTATVGLQLDAEGDLIIGVADMDREQLPAPCVAEVLRSRAPDSRSRVIAFDANLSVDAMSTILTERSQEELVLVEPTSGARSYEILEALAAVPPEKRRIDILTPNLVELNAMFDHATWLKLRDWPGEKSVRDSHAPDGSGIDDKISFTAAEIAKIVRGTLLVKLGAQGVLCAIYIDQGRKAPKVSLSHHPAASLPASAMLNTTGAGDTFAGAILACASEVLRARRDAGQPPPASADLPWPEMIHLAQEAARLTLASEHAVSPELGTLAQRVREIGQLTLLNSANGQSQ